MVSTILGALISLGGAFKTSRRASQGCWCELTALRAEFLTRTRLIQHVTQIRVARSVGL